MAGNVHGTAIVIGTTGFLFVGPSGSGKSSMALDCIMGAERSGLFAALVSDDQVLVSKAGGHLVARAPASIKGLIEIRGTGIVRLNTLDAAVLQYAILPLSPPFAERVPPENEIWEMADGQYLPLIRLALAAKLTVFDRLKAVLPAIGAV
ncbi:HPr kinase/phosphorylase [Pararhizobium sp.]|uniref:HPr kinase/phosphorylase n=1 Tax=Pararhizobium sp. TaxID=1977563 RepID=UPI0027205F57|nr:HPr kinase/phosphorylase [Pararhizobium sp.]MDO9416839.1 HPr kinase/phosphorylase [Pararhizobium sp.]